MTAPFTRLKSGRRPDFNYDIVYNSNNYGQFIILEESDIPGYNKRAVKIRFLNTGTILTVKYSQAMYGRVKDPYAPSIYGVGCLGNASCYDIGHTIWRNCMSRCYNINCSDYANYGGIGVSVCQRWHCFENFLADLPYIEGYDKWINNQSAYHLDKDFKQQDIPPNQRIYSLETCMFVPSHSNVALSDIKSNKYIGVESNGNNSYRVRPRVNGRRELIGTFDSPEVAAAAYNNFMTYTYGKDFVPLNDVPYMSPVDVMANNKHPRVMYKLIDKK